MENKQADVGGNGGYEATITWTTHGVPHIEASDWGGLGFGQGWACARDHYAAMCDHATKVASQRSRHLGRGENDRHLHSDLGYLGLGLADRAAAMASNQPAEIVSMVTGYAAGASAWFAERGREGLPRWAADEPWIRPIEPGDLWRIYLDLTLMASGRNLVEYIGSAVPPGGDEPGVVHAHGGMDPSATPGSNAWAFGGDVTANGRGIVMGNPHFPWQGEGRFWECHLRLPGELDVYGASLVGTPLVQIGFNERVAWSHTFSRGHRFTVYSLDLPPGRPTSYRYGDEERSMASARHAVEVRTSDGPLETVERTLWSSHYGPMLNLPLLGWNEPMGFSYRDANFQNDRLLRQFLAMNRAASVDEFRTAFATIGGIPWANTLVADDAGDAWYADASATPKLTAEAQAGFIERVACDPITALVYSLRVALLPGSDPTYEWVDDPRAAQAGIEPFSALPQLSRRDALFNSNDPYWLANAHEHLSEHSPMCGLYHAPVGSRTRMNGRTVRDAGDLDVDAVAALVLSNRSLIAELALDALIERWNGALRTGPEDDSTAAVARALPVLTAWDRRLDLDSIGAALFREFLGSLPDGAVGGAGVLWAQAFDPERPLDTPCDIAPRPATGNDPLVGALAGAVAVLDQAGLALDAPLRDVQFVDRSGAHWPISGGFELEGVCNINASLGTLARADLEPALPQGEGIPGRTERTGIRVGGYPVIYGVSFLMIAGFDDRGPVARGLLVYGQSQNEASIHCNDQLAAFGAKQLRPLLFRTADIAAFAEESRVVRGR